MDKAAYVRGSNLPVSTKHCREIASFIKGKEERRVITLLEQVVAQKTAVPFRRFNRDVGHRPGHVGPGRYPEKASRMVISLLKSLVANAQQKGLDVKSLCIASAIANIASRPARYGRHRRRVTKRSHFEITAVEKETKIEPRAEKPQAQQQQKKPAHKMEKKQ